MSPWRIKLALYHALWNLYWSFFKSSGLRACFSSHPILPPRAELDMLCKLSCRCSTSTILLNNKLLSVISHLRVHLSNIPNGGMLHANNVMVTTSTTYALKPFHALQCWESLMPSTSSSPHHSQSSAISVVSTPGQDPAVALSDNMVLVTQSVEIFFDCPEDWIIPLQMTANIICQPMGTLSCHLTLFVLLTLF